MWNLKQKNTGFLDKNVNNQVIGAKYTPLDPKPITYYLISFDSRNEETHMH